MRMSMVDHNKLISVDKKKEKKNREMPGCNIGPEHCDCC